MHWLIACVHLHAVVDRIEPPFVIVEWTQTGQLSDVPLRWVPLQTKEGDPLLMHVRTAKHKAHSLGMGRHHSFPNQIPTSPDFDGIIENHRRHTNKQQWERLLGAPTRIFMGAGKRRHESKTSKQRVGVSLIEEED